MTPDEILFLAIPSQSVVYYTGRFITGNIPGIYGRIYPSEVIAAALDMLTKHITEMGPIPGELGQPYSLRVNVGNVSHTIHEVWMSGDDAYCKIKIINEGTGKIVCAMLSNGIEIKLLARATGIVDTYGRVSELNVITIDIDRC